LSAAKKIILLLWLVLVASLGNALASTPGATENRTWEKSSGPLETRLGESLQTLGRHQENEGAGYDYAVDSLLAAESEMTVEGQLQTHLQNAIDNYQLTPAQEDALVNNPGLEGAFRGTQIDTLFKANVEADPFLQQQGIMTTPRGQFGPDVFNPETQQWWDATTPGQWNAHVQQYWLFGNGSPLFTHP
jgi:hypothetical protein